MTSSTNLKHGVIVEDYYGHQGALYKDQKVLIKEIKSERIKIETTTGKIYWLDSKYVTIS